MRHPARYIAVVAGLLVALAAPAADNDWQHPAIQGYGDVTPLPEAVNRPDPETAHKAAFELRTTPDDPGRLNPGLERVARAVNVFAALVCVLCEVLSPNLPLSLSLSLSLSFDNVLSSRSPSLDSPL